MRILSATKKHALSRGHLGCLGDVATINVVRGCAGRCVFCYARCLSGVPSSDELLVYTELPKQLSKQLDRRRRPPPPFVLFSTASDPFLGGEHVLQIVRESIRLLVEREIGISLSTRGEIPHDIIALLSGHAPFVRITIPLVSLCDNYTSQWEPGTLLPRERLFLTQRLLKTGLLVQLRVDPLIPFVNDQTDQIHQLISAIAGIGQQHAMVSFLHLRPGVEQQIKAEAPQDLADLVLGSFSHPPDLMFPQQQTKFHHLPVKQRMAGLRRIQRIARQHGIRVSACHCQNPGIAAKRCPIIPNQLPDPVGSQLTMLE